MNHTIGVAHHTHSLHLAMLLLTHVVIDTYGSEEEGESLTVPLQPFDHAVGGHSSIYKFTRRAVCKVSLVRSF